MHVGQLLRLFTITTCCLLLGAASAHAIEGWQLRVRAIGVAPNDSSKEVTTLDDSSISVDSDVTLEVDLTMWATKTWALELIAATTEHDLNAEGSIKGLGKIADAWVLPPTLTLQYHFRPDRKVRPYLGLGINYSIFYDEDATVELEAALCGATPDCGGTSVHLDDSFGPAVQVGVDVQLSEHWYFNLDLKHIWMDTTGHLITDDGLSTHRTVDVELDPWVPGIGFGYRF